MFPDILTVHKLTSFLWSTNDTEIHYILSKFLPVYHQDKVTSVNNLAQTKKSKRLDKTLEALKIKISGDMLIHKDSGKLGCDSLVWQKHLRSIWSVIVTDPQTSVIVTQRFYTIHLVIEKPFFALGLL